MNFTCRTADFEEAVAAASRAVTAKSSIEAAEGLLIRANREGIRVVGYNLTAGIGIEMSCEGTVDESGAIVLPMRTLSEIVRKLPEETMVFRSSELFSSTITSGEAESSVMGISPEDFPALPEVIPDQVIALSYETLKNLTRRTAFSVAITDARPILTGVLFEIENDHIRTVALDGVRLALANDRLTRPIDGRYSFVVPGKNVTEMARTIKETDEEIEILLSDKHLQIQKGNITFVTRLLDGKFLPYEAVIPKEVTMSAVVDVQEMIESVERTGVIINERMRTPLILRFEEQSLKTYCSSSTGCAKDRIAAQIDGPTTEIGVNNRYLLEALKAADCERVRFEIQSRLSPMVIKPEEGDAFSFIIVPLNYAKAGDGC